MREALLFIAILFATPAFAVLPSETLPDQALEARARALSAELRCMVCQNQSIDDSEAPLAADLRVLVRERLIAGDSDEQVLDFLVARYGEFILLKPRFAWHTALLWATPPVVLILGGVIAAVAYSRRRRTMNAPAPLRPEEQETLRSLVSNPDRPNITET